MTRLCNYYLELGSSCQTCGSKRDLTVSYLLLLIPGGTTADDAAKMIHHIPEDIISIAENISLCPDATERAWLMGSVIITQGIFSLEK